MYNTTWVWILCLYMAIPCQLSAQNTDTAAQRSNISDTFLSTKKSSINSPIHYHSADSLTLNVESGLAKLYRKADVKFENTQLQSAYIEVRLSKKILYAKGRLDSAGNYVDKPLFKDNGETYEADSMMYSSQTQKGKVFGLRLKQDEAYVQLKAVVKQPDGSFMGANGKLTTCDADHPHFYLNTSKIKIMPNNKALFGPANMVFMGIPTPLALPFGLAPLQKGRRNGILMPNYGYFRSNRSFFLSNLGYYTALGQYADAQISTDVFLNGDLRGKFQTNFTKRYHWRGSLSLQASRFGNGLDFAHPEYKKNLDYGIVSQFSMDPKLFPGVTFNGNINIVTGDFNKRNATDVRSLNNNQFTSSINYGRNFLKNKVNLSASARHSQNTQTRDFRLELPTVNLGVSSLTPFARKTGSNSNWYRQIRLSYTLNLANILNTKDSLVFSEQFRNTFNSNLQSGLKHRIPISTNIKLFNGTLNISPSINYGEVWYHKAKIQRWDAGSKKVQFSDSAGFFRIYDYSASANLNTNIYGTFNQLNWGQIKAIRHTITPSIGFSYRPEINAEEKGWIKNYTDSSGKQVKYNIFSGSLYGGNGQVGGGSLTYGISNNFQAKKLAENDSTGKQFEKVNLIDQLSFNGNYNFFADSLNFSDINSTLNTVLFKQIRIGVSSSHSFYSMKNGRAINEFYWNEKNQPLRFRNASASVNSRITPGMLKGESKSKKSTPKNADEEELEQVNNNPWNYFDFNIPWSLNFTYNINYNSEVRGNANKITNNRITVNGDLNITSEWKIAYQSGWDFARKEIAGSQFTVVRSLHCWQLEFTFIPSGYGKQWLFSLRPKSPLLRDLKLNKTVTSNPALIQLR